MSKVKPRGEVSPLTAAAVAFCMLGISGLSVWRYVIHDTPASSAPARQMESVKVPAAAGSGIYPKQQSRWSVGTPIQSVQDK